jgi:hypothetical protein
MFSGQFKEAKENEATLPEDDPRAFGILIQWVYTGTLKSINFRIDDKGNKIGDIDGVQIYNRDMLLVYELADKLCMSYFMDKVMSALIAFQKTTMFMFEFQTIKFHYGKIPKGSPLRKYFGHCIHFILRELHNEKERSNWPTSDAYQLMRENEDIGIDVLELIRNHPPGTHVTEPWSLPLCTFHTHGPDGKCPDKVA